MGKTPDERVFTRATSGASISRATDDVSRYYDENTRQFLRTGHGSNRHAIRRAVWGPGVHDRDSAISYVNDLIRDEARLRPGDDSSSVLDLGCGVGGSILELAPGLPGRYLGLTLSRVQAEIGTQLLKENGLEDAAIEVADFTDEEFWSGRDDPPFDLAYAIESMLHVPEILAKLSTIRSLMRPGGLLVVVDDFIARGYDPAAAPSRQRRWLSDFRLGWYAHGLAPCAEFLAAAEGAGFELVEGRDLTPYLELGRPRDRLARALVAATRWMPLRPEWYNNLLGGNALQMCLKNGVVRYLYLVFRASEPQD